LQNTRFRKFPQKEEEKKEEEEEEEEMKKYRSPGIAPSHTWDRRPY
jgi:hypothetical protein